MKRQFAALDWNEQKSSGENKDVQIWQIELLRRFESALASKK